MITLINPPGTKTLSGLQMHTPNPPLGLAYVAAALREAGHPYHVIDATGEALDSVHPYPGRDDFLVQGLSFDQVVERIPVDTHVIGVSCLFSTLWPLTRLLADRIRAAFPHATLVLGSEHGTAVYEHVLTHSPFDIVVLGEGEETFLSLLKALEQGSPLADVKGIAYRDNGQVTNTGLSPRRRDVDSIPLPDWDSFPIKEYINRHQISGVNLGRSMPILSTRGCPYQCTFCSNPGMWTRRWIPRAPSKVVDEMALYHSKYDAVNFDFQDLTSIVKRRWLIEFCNELIQRDLSVTWQMPSGTRAEAFDEEVAALLYRSGCRALAFAPESGDERILKSTKKQVDLKHFKVAARIAIRHKLKLSCFFVIGFPDETEESMRHTLRLIRRLAVMGVHDVAVSKFVPYPGSELFRRLQQEGKIALDDAFFVSPMDFYTTKAPSYADAISTARLYFMMNWMFVNFYVISFALRPWRVASTLAKAMLSGQEETRYAKWFMDRFFTRRRWRKLSRNTSAP